MKKIITILLDDDENVLSRAETDVETSDDIARHLEKFHSIEIALERQIDLEIEQDLIED